MSFALDIAAIDIGFLDSSMSMDGIEYMSYMSMVSNEYGTSQAGTTSKGSKSPQVAKAGKKTDGPSVAKAKKDTDAKASKDTDAKASKTSNAPSESPSESPSLSSAPSVSSAQLCTEPRIVH